MGIIDSTRYRLTCSSCGTVETAAAHQTGSAYSSGPWRSPKADTFKLRLEHDAYDEPVIKSAQCPCGGEVEVVIAGTGP